MAEFKTFWELVHSAVWWLISSIGGVFPFGVGGFCGVSLGVVGQWPLTFIAVAECLASEDVCFGRDGGWHLFQSKRWEHVQIL